METTLLRVVAFVRHPGLFLSREFETDKFPSLGDTLRIGDDDFEVLTIDQIAFDTIAVEVACSRPFLWAGWFEFGLRPETWDVPSVQIAKELYT